LIGVLDVIALITFYFFLEVIDIVEHVDCEPTNELVKLLRRVLNFSHNFKVKIIEADGMFALQDGDMVYHFVRTMSAVSRR